MVVSFAGHRGQFRLQVQGGLSLLMLSSRNLHALEWSHIIVAPQTAHTSHSRFLPRTLRGHRQLYALKTSTKLELASSIEVGHAPDDLLPAFCSRRDDDSEKPNDGGLLASERLGGDQPPLTWWPACRSHGHEARHRKSSSPPHPAGHWEAAGVSKNVTAAALEGVKQRQAGQRLTASID